MFGLFIPVKVEHDEIVERDSDCRDRSLLNH
jgi:hypothetical protein